jgi:hypothetical protein
MLKLKNILTVGCLALLLGLVAFSVSLWQTPKYKSTVKLLTVFNQANVDTYTASKTANYITGILGEVAYSDSFVNSVYQSDSNLIDTLGNNSEIRQKNWKKAVKLNILENKGVIIIDTYGDNKYQTNLLSSTIGSVIISQHGLYDGSADRTVIKMIDSPSVYEDWAITKIARDTGIGLLAGLLLGLTLVIIFPSHKLFEFSTKRGFENQIDKEPAQPEITVQPRTAGDQPKVTNPWLEKYYQENSNV